MAWEMEKVPLSRLEIKARKPTSRSCRAQRIDEFFLHYSHCLWINRPILGHSERPSQPLVCKPLFGILLVLRFSRFYLLFSTLAYTAITDDVPTFTGWRTIDISNNDVDKIQLSTRTVRAGLLFLSFANTSSASFFRLTVIYTRYVRGIIVFKVGVCIV